MGVGFDSSGAHSVGQLSLALSSVDLVSGMTREQVLEPGFECLKRLVVQVLEIHESGLGASRCSEKLVELELQRDLVAVLSF